MIEISRQVQKQNALETLRHENAYLKEELRLRLKAEKAFKDLVTQKIQALEALFDEAIRKKESAEAEVVELENKLKKYEGSKP